MSPAEQRRIVVAATGCAAVVIASQLAGKAARDAIFLQRFPVTNLPVLLALSSALSIALTFLFAHRLSRGVPARVVRLANLGSALAFLAEWALLDELPRPMALVIYMHQMVLGPILVSGFWSVIAECFDPRSARAAVGTIGTGATIGGLGGALLSERVAWLFGTAALLPTIAILQLLVAWRLGTLAHSGSAAEVATTNERGGELEGVIGKLVKVSLLRRLAVILVTVTVGAAALDYVFKEAATRAVQPDNLARLFATYHGVVGLFTAIAAGLLGRRALQSWGLARTLATLPAIVILLGALALAVPTLGTFVLLRGGENVFRNSLFRQAYEVFYTPLSAPERRATKTVIDVGVERLGDVFGGLLVLAILALAYPATTILLIAAIALASLGVIVALRAQHSYVEALERSLAARAIELDREAAADRTTRMTIELVRGGGTTARAKRPRDGEPDAELARLLALRDADPRVVRGALLGPPSAAWLACAIPLLDRADVGDDVRRAIALAAPAHVGQLIDAVHDPTLPVGVRKRLPALIALGDGELARAGLLGCLDSEELELRCRAAEALLELRERDPSLVLDHAAVFDGVRRELAGEREVWTTLHPSLTSPGLFGAPPALSRAAQHLANLLALAFPAEPIKAAFRDLWSDDQRFRGVALEYLDNVLPPDIRDQMWIALAIEAPIAATRRPVEDIRAELLRAQLERDRRREARS